MSYLFEMHYHTPETSYCCRISPDKSFPHYVSDGYSGIVITDHYYYEWFDNYSLMSWHEKVDCWLTGYRSAKEIAKEYPLNIILGMELRFPENFNDYLVYGMDEDMLYQYPELYEMTPEEFRIFADEHGLFFAQAHPFRLMCSPLDPRLLHGIEVYNGNMRHNNRNHLAKKSALKNKLVSLSGSDFHETEDICRGGVYLRENPDDSKKLAELLHGKHICGVKITDETE